MQAHRKNPAAMALGARGGRAGRGAAKRRGNAEYYRGLVALRRDRAKSGMSHRHLVHQEFTLAAVDDIIARGGLAAWTALKRETNRDALVRSKVLQVCRSHRGDPYAQRYLFWADYAARKTAA